MKIYRVAQVVIYRGDPKPFDIKGYDSGYGVKEMGKELGSSMAYGPGIYFVTNEEYARYYGSNVSKFKLNSSRILAEGGNKLSIKQIEGILNSAGEEKLELAISNFDEDYGIGKKMLMQEIMSEADGVGQLMNIWADVFYHQNPNLFMEVMKSNGIDGIAKVKDDATYYVIYNKAVLV